MVGVFNYENEKYVSFHLCFISYLQKKAVSCTWEGQDIMRWYNFPATVSLAGRFRGSPASLRNKRFGVILSPIQRQQKRNRNRARKQSGQRQSEECVGENNSLCMPVYLFCGSCSALTRHIGRSSAEGTEQSIWKGWYWWVPSLWDEAGLSPPCLGTGGGQGASQKWKVKWLFG